MSSNSENRAAWYGDGLRFECTQCGNCCTGSPGYVWVDDTEIAALAEHLDRPIGEIRLLHTRPARGQVSLREHANGDCIYFDPEQRRCTVYKVRPKQCRSWPFWKSTLASPEAWSETQRECPGAGQGGFVSVEELEQAADLIEL